MLFKSRWLLSVAAAALIFSPAVHAGEKDMVTSEQAIPQDNLAYPVLVIRKNGEAGSGFFLDTPQAIYFVTANHILTDSFIYDSATQKYKPDAQLELMSPSKDPSDKNHNLLLLNMEVLQNDGNIQVVASEDVAVVKIGTISSPSGDTKSITSAAVPGVKFLEKTASGILGVNVNAIRAFDKVTIGNDVVMFGYPVSLGVKQVPQIDSHNPLLRKGIVAGKNPERHSIVLDCPAYPGNSGGPIFEIDRDGHTTHFSLIGVVREYVPFAQVSPTFWVINNSGYSIAAPMDAILDLVK